MPRNDWRRRSRQFTAGRKFDAVTADVGPRANQTIDALAKLRPIFDRKDGSVTVGNSCQVTDGAASVLLMDADLAKAEDASRSATCEHYAYAGLDPAAWGWDRCSRSINCCGRPGCR